VFWMSTPQKLAFSSAEERMALFILMTVAIRPGVHPFASPSAVEKSAPSNP